MAKNHIYNINILQRKKKEQLEDKITDLQKTANRRYEAEKQ